MNLFTIEDKLKQVCSDNPLDNNISKYKFRAHIRLANLDAKIKVLFIQYTREEDREEFSRIIRCQSNRTK